MKYRMFIPALTALSLVLCLALIAPVLCMADEVVWPVKCYEGEELQKVREWEKTWAGKRIDINNAAGVKEYLLDKYYEIFTDPAWGGDYYFDIPGNQSWRDGGIECGPAGWDRSSATLGMKEIFQRIKQDERRFPDAKWFELIGAVGKNDDHLLRILNYQDAAHPFKAVKGGEFFAFPNDLDRSYSNNLGFVKLVIHRVS